MGAFNNNWTLRLTGELRFYFEYDPERKVEILRDRQNPENRSWQVRTDTAIPQIETDYAIVTRVHNPTTEQTVVVAAGIRGGGTSAASEFLTNEAYLTQALGSAPSGWEQKERTVCSLNEDVFRKPGATKCGRCPLLVDV